MNKKFAVVSHTHWDREWYRPFEEFRLNLVRLIDGLLVLFQEEPDYIFHLDAQTVVLEDYLAIKPQNEELLKKYISSGNLVVGPWYLQNDFYLTSGEATVRNLLFGTRLAQKFGKCSRTGYMPDQFGIISAMPQILNGFQIPSAVFGRGYMEYEMQDGKPVRVSRPPEFIWKSKDGAFVLAVFLQRWYNNAQRLPADKEELKNLLQQNESAFSLSRSPVILLMNGVDHLFFQRDAHEIIARSQDVATIEHMRLDEYIEILRQNGEKMSLDTYVGSLDRGTDYEVLKGCRSSRIYLKQANVRAQDLLEHKLEPLYALAEWQGCRGIYPASELCYLWKSLLKLHPHDNICGCSTDGVHRHMKDRFEQIEECANALLERGAFRLARRAAKGGEYSITLFNPTELTFTGVADVVLDIPVGEEMKGIRICDGKGKEVSFAVLSARRCARSEYSDLNLPAVTEVTRYDLRIAAQVRAYGVQTFAVYTDGKKRTPERSAGASRIENAAFELGFDGEPYLVDKKSGERIDRPFFFEDCADRGDSYVFRKDGSAPLRFEAKSFRLVKNTSLEKIAEFTYELDLPCGYDFRADRRAARSLKAVARVRASLRGESDTLAVEYSFVNRSKEHRLQLGIRAGGEKVYADEPYSVCECTNKESCIVTDSNVRFNSTFIAAGNAQIYTEGQHEFCIGNKEILLTVLRATGAIARNEFTLEAGGDESWLVPENQMLGRVQGRFGLRFAKTFAAGEAFARAKQFRAGLVAACVPLDPKKYLRGGAAVQTSKSDHVYLSPDPFERVSAETEFPLRWNSPYLAVTAIKRSENGNYFLARLINLSEKERKVTFAAAGELYETNLEEGEFAPIQGRELCFAPGQIRTLALKF